MISNVSSIMVEECTGCRCCVNVCPQKAITMQENNEYFYMPVVNEELCNNCGLCLKRCPSKCSETNDNSIPIPIAARCSDELRKKSSSGGMFGIFADWIINNNGYVCGAVFDEKLRLHHIVSNSVDDVEKMKGSKYLQSNTEYVYRQIKELLRGENKVLFVGTPCQVVALYSYLGSREDNNLYTIDLVCHGVPSQHSFDDYINENHYKKIEKFEFRSKVNGWRADCVNVSYADGTVYEGNMHFDLLKPMDTYELGFQKNIILRKSCGNCKFCEFPRVGDVTLGDFWGINKIDSSQNDGKGTSLVFINNVHGKDLFMSVEENVNYKEFDIPISFIQNRLKAYYPQHVQRERYFSLRRTGHSFNEAINYVYNKKYDIGIVGIYTVDNFGGALTYYALYHTIEDLGYSALMIERPKESNHKPGSTKLYTEDPYPEYAKAKIYDKKEQMTELNDCCDTFLVGSDQLFNNFLYNQFGKWVTLDWVEDNKRKIAYAASFGHDFIWHPEETRAEMSYFMKKFDAFSVREESGIEICNKDFGIDAEWVLDPVFLCEKKYYDELVEKSGYAFPEQFIGAYILDLSKDRQNIIEEVSNKLKLSYSIFSEMNWKDLPRNGWTLEIEDSKFINDRIRNIAKCNFFIADSFHGICIAIIYRKNFIAILNEKRGASRFKTILGKLGLMNRVVKDYSALLDNKDIFNPIDYDEVYKKLNKEKLRCRNWLLNSLKTQQKKSYSDYHYIKKYSDEQKKEIAQLKTENKKLEMQLSTLYRAFELYINEGSNQCRRSVLDIMQLSNESNIYQYLKKVRQCKSEYLMIVTVRDNVGFYMNEELQCLLNDIGCDLDWCNIPKHTSYVYIEDKGHVLFHESNYDRETVCNMQIEKMNLYAESRLYLQGNRTKIIINGIDYAVNERGINIVIYDKENGKLIDSVCFDTHAQNFKSYRRGDV